MTPVPRVTLLAAAVLAIATVSAAPAAAAPHAQSYYVSPTGADTGNGTSAHPFRHIQRCADLMTAGDTCVIRPGVYRETVRPARSGTALAPITYRASGPGVVIDGADPVGSWQQVSGADLAGLQSQDPTLTGSEFAAGVAAGTVFRADVGVPADLPGVQVFRGAGMAPEAAWPHAGDDPAHPALASADSGTQTTLGDDALGQPAGYWVGARLTSHNWFVSETGRVTSSAPGSVTAASLPSCVGLSPNQRNLYSLSGKLALIGRTGEWFYDTTAHRLYMQLGSASAGSDVTVKKRTFGLDLSGRSYVAVDGLGLHGTSVTTSDTSAHLTLNNLNARYVSAYSDLAVDPGKVTPADACDVLTAGETTSGILLRGQNNTLSNSTIAYSAGNGVLVAGTANTVSNTLITDTDYLGSYAAGINVLGSDHQLLHNTLVGSGRSSINIDNKVAGTTASGIRMAYNDLGDYGRLVNDVGAIYICCSVNLAGTRIDHNTMHDAAPVAAAAPAPGVYLDLGTYNGVIDNNVTWNKTTYGVVLINPNGASASGTKVIANTSGTDSKALSLFGGTYSGIEVTDNLGTVDSAPGATLTGNLPNSGAGFVGPATHDFSVSASSPARNAGVVRSPYTDGSTDAAPTVGAYQFGAPVWRAGAHLTETTVQGESFSSSAGVNTRAGASGTVFGSFDGGDWVGYSAVDFGAGRDTLRLSIATDDPYAGQRIDVRIGSLTGPSIGTLTVNATGGFDNFSSQYAPIARTTGVHDVYLVALGTGPGVGDVDTVSFGTVTP